MAVSGGGLSGTLRQWTERGCGAFGTWMPTDDFTRAWRRTVFQTAAARPAASLRLYVDGSRLMREVTDVCSLRRGDHCVIAVKVARALSPTFDWLTSVASRYGCVGVYHHFVVLGDVAYLDAGGVPRDAAGKAVQILEYTNTVRESLNTIADGSKGSLSRVPLEAGSFLLFHKGQCQAMALADYGDMPCFFVLLQSLTEGERDTIVKRAAAMAQDHEPYNALVNNCEHCVNAVCIGRSISPQVPIVFQRMARVSVRLLALLGLAAGGAPRRGGPALPALCSTPAWTWLCRGVGLLTMVVPAVVRYWQATTCLRAHRDLGLYESREAQRFLVTERLRLLVAGGGGAAAFLLADRWRMSAPGTAAALCWWGSSLPNIAVTCAAALAEPR